MHRQLLAAAFVAALAPGVVAQNPAVRATAMGPSLGLPGGTLVVAGNTPSLTLLYTGDVIGFVDPCG